MADEALVGHRVVIRYGRTGAMSLSATVVGVGDGTITIKNGWGAVKCFEKDSITSIHHMVATCLSCKG